MRKRRGFNYVLSQANTRQTFQEGSSNNGSMLQENHDSKKERPKPKLPTNDLSCILYCFVAAIVLLLCIYYVVNSRYTQGQIRTGLGDMFETDNNCGCFPHDGTGARIAYLVTLHNQRTLDDSVTLVKKLAAASNIILIHIDTKLPFEDYEKSDLKEFVHGDCKACEATVLVERKFDVKWAEWSMNDPTHWSMIELVANPKFIDKWDVYINLSSDSLPVYTPQIMSNLFQSRKGKNGGGTQDHSLQGYNFVTSSSCITGLLPTNINIFPPMWHKRQHYEQHGDFIISYIHNGEEKTEKLIIHFGSQWMILTPDFVKYLVTSLQDRDSLTSKFKAELIARRVLMSDETFIPTLLANHPSFSHTMPILENDQELRIKSTNVTFAIKSIRFERMDENIPDAFGNVVNDQRYQVPDSAIHVDIPREWGPYYLGVYDLGRIKDSGALFVRKVSRTIDPNLHHLLPVTNPEQIPTIRWPSEIKISRKINWEPIIKYTKYMREQ